MARQAVERFQNRIVARRHVVRPEPEPDLIRGIAWGTVAAIPFWTAVTLAVCYHTPILNAGRQVAQFTNNKILPAYHGLNANIRPTYQRTIFNLKNRL
jgi:hypothetical protein